MWDTRGLLPRGRRQRMCIRRKRTSSAAGTHPHKTHDDHFIPVLRTAGSERVDIPSAATCRAITASHYVIRQGACRQTTIVMMKNTLTEPSVYTKFFSEEAFAVKNTVFTGIALFDNDLPGLGAVVA